MPARRWVAVTATADFPVALAPIKQALAGIAPVRTVPLPFRPLMPAEEASFARRLRGAEGILLRPGYITASLLDRLPDLRAVAVHGAGVDQVDVPACTQRGVLVTNAPGANADSVAELALGLMLSLARRIPEAARRVKEERAWGEARHTGRELKGKTLGIVGLGQIGARLARLAAALGMEVTAHDPALRPAEIRRRGARPLALDALLREADCLSLHAPLMPSTHHLIDRKAIARMKKGAFLVNCARGPLVDELAVARALRSGRLGGAALDVLEGEPPDPGSPIFGAPNLVLTPHMAGSTVEALEAIARAAGEDLARVLSGKPPKFPVNRPSAGRSRLSSGEGRPEKAKR
ncbi:MAG: hydroxyacid dehydrogenase [Candidatus Tectomicrobia bacterium]|uniref:Hydroxyacid dehydrogenase n=1 Tax=Tectimicrobiota bacterium TaxID=2528274 RepID=A0A932HYD4_UNCTE|nr:hydroxyacid dehydrogenase [Candidatus Tectomicrobia bacterium]